MERTEKPDPELPGVTCIANPILEETVLGITREKETDSSMVHMVLDIGEDIDQTVRAVAEKTGDAVLAEQLRILFSVHESYIETLFQVMEKEYRSAERFLSEEMDMGKDALETLKNKYLQ